MIENKIAVVNARSATRGFLWMAAAGAVYSLNNAMLRGMSMELGAFQILALVYAGSLLAMVPMLIARGVTPMGPRRLSPIVVRGVIHWAGMSIWLFALAHVTLAETTAISFTGPLFISAGGAALLLKEPMRWERVTAAVVGFGGVIVVLHPRLAGNQQSAYALMMLVSTAVFAMSFLLAKRLTQSERPGVIVAWQSLVITACSFPLAALNWTSPTHSALLTALVCGILTLVGNYCYTRAFGEADISATQPAKFLDLVWAAILGWLLFEDRVETTTWVGAAIILGATIWAARRERQDR